MAIIKITAKNDNVEITTSCNQNEIRLNKQNTGDYEIEFPSENGALCVVVNKENVSIS